MGKTKEDIEKFLKDNEYMRDDDRHTDGFLRGVDTVFNMLEKQFVSQNTTKEKGK